MSLYPNVTIEQQEAIDELKRRTINYLSPTMLPDESIFYRFSKAHNFNVKVAETMLRKYIDFRKEYQVDTILTDYKPPEVLSKYGPSNFIGYDKEGFIVRYADVGEVDARVSIYFYMGFSVLKTFIAAPSLEKVKIYASEGWKEALLELIDADELPKFLGGNKTDPDGNPLCKTFIKHGQKVPKSYYLCNTEKKLSLAADVLKITITRFSKEEISFEVTVAGTYLEWEFETKNKDICFSLSFRKHAFDEPVTIVPKQRIDTYYEPEKGLFKCDEVGTYLDSVSDVAHLASRKIEKEFVSLRVRNPYFLA
ncbi:retinal-binding protein [Nephila pilipes]|uniref:Retinal-binding protein n=1 Tax=Nephila pilipes TaxID=299642 RepID=A0A8X6Q5U6_NEPPI|nr:retinal-binding protein [Nephila pilipes]